MASIQSRKRYTNSARTSNRDSKILATIHQITNCFRANILSNAQLLWEYSPCYLTELIQRFKRKLHFRLANMTWTRKENVKWDAPKRTTFQAAAASSSTTSVSLNKSEDQPQNIHWIFLCNSGGKRFQTHACHSIFPFLARVISKNVSFFLVSFCSKHYSYSIRSNNLETIILSIVH